MPIRNTTLDTQNEVKEIAVTSSADGKVAVNIEGDFDSANVEIGRKDVDDTFRPYAFGTFTDDDDVEVKCGRDRPLYARATGASPDVNIQTSPIS